MSSNASEHPSGSDRQFATHSGTSPNQPATAVEGWARVAARSPSVTDGDSRPTQVEDSLDSATDRVPRNGDLATQLAEKESLVLELTAQLERAAEQLDRLNRSGADRRRSGYLPAEVAEDHKHLVAELQRVVQQWEDLQAGLTLGRIEVQITELRDFVGEKLGGGRSFTPSTTDHYSSYSAPSVVHHEPSPEPESEPSSSSSGEEPSSWERLKNQMLEPQAEATPHAPVAAFDEPLPEPPPPIDWSTATPAMISAAVEARDDFINYLLRRVRSAEAFAAPQDWTQIDAHDAELSARLQHLSIQLDEKLRMAEIEFSLERAKMAREHGRLIHDQEALDKQLKRLGAGSVDEVEQTGANLGSQQDRRWSRFLGRKGNP